VKYIKDENAKFIVFIGKKRTEDGEFTFLLHRMMSYTSLR